MIVSQQNNLISERESGKQESWTDDVKSEVQSDSMDEQQHAIESEKEPGALSKLKRSLRNFRYRKSPGGQQRICQLKKDYKNKDHAKELNKKYALKYQSGSPGQDVLKKAMRKYHSSSGGKSTLKKAAS